MTTVTVTRNDKTISIPNDGKTITLSAGKTVSIAAVGPVGPAGTFTAGDGLDLTGTVFSTDLKANGGLVIDTTELAVDFATDAETNTGTSTALAITPANITAWTGSTAITTLGTIGGDLTVNGELLVSRSVRPGSTGQNLDLKTGTGFPTRFTITTVGDVGINVALPVSLFEVRGNVGAAGTITISTAETTIVDGNILGRINFQAPEEVTGSDAILVAASIYGEADATFSATVNTTDLVFATATSGTATEKMRVNAVELNLISGLIYSIAGTSVLSATTLGAAVVTSSLTTVGALNSGSITSGFGSIDNGASNITTGGIIKIDVDGSAENAAGSLTFGAGNDAGIFFDGTDLVIITNGAGASGIKLDSEDDTVEILGSGVSQALFGTGVLNLASGSGYAIGGIFVLNATTLFGGVITSSLTTVGALDSGSITSGFGNIDVGASSIAAGSFDVSDGNITNVGDIALDTISADGTSITLNNNIFTADGTHIVVGHTAQITSSNTSEFQVLGTSGADGSIIIARFSANASPPSINFTKSRSGTIGTSTLLQDNDEIGQLKFNAADGSGLGTRSATIMVEVDDPTPAVGDIGAAFTWNQMPGGGGARRETMRLTAAGQLLIGTAIAEAPLHVSIDDAVNDGITDVMILEHTTSGTPTDGIGLGMSFRIEDDAGSAEVAAIDVILDDVTDGTEDSTMSFNVMVQGVLREALRFQKSSGSATRQFAYFPGAGTTLPGLSADAYLVVGGRSANNDRARIHVVGGTSAFVSLDFGDNNDANAGSIEYDNFTDSLKFKVNVSERFRVDSSGNFVIGATTADVRFHVEEDSAATNTVTRVARFTSTSSGTPANNIGVGLEFEVETAAGNNEVGAAIDTIATDTTATSEDFAMSFLQMSAGSTTLVESLRLEGTKVGFYATPPVVQASALTAQDTSITHTAPGTPNFAIQDLIDSGVGSTFGFATKDEGNTVLQVILNLQVRVLELETALANLGLTA